MTILMVKDDGLHEMKDLPVMYRMYLRPFEGLSPARGDTLMIELDSWTTPVSRSTSGDGRTEKADGKVHQIRILSDRVFLHRDHQCCCDDGSLRHCIDYKVCTSDH